MSSVRKPSVIPLYWYLYTDWFIGIPRSWSIIITNICIHIYIYIYVLGSIISYNHQSHNGIIIFPVLGVFKIPNRGFHLMDGTTAPSTWWQAPLAKWRGQQKDRNRRNQLDYGEGQMLVGLWKWKVKHEDKDRQISWFAYIVVTLRTNTFRGIQYMLCFFIDETTICITYLIICIVLTWCYIFSEYII